MPPRQQSEAGQSRTVPRAALPTAFTAILILALAGICALVFWPVTANGFVAFDDDANIYFNEHMGGLSLARVRWAFSDFGYIDRYMPLGWLTYAAAFSLWGLDPAGYHLFSLILHAANAVMLFIILEKLGNGFLADADDAPKKTIVAAFLAAAWWALNPMRSEVLGWATCLIYSVGLLFTLTAFAVFLTADPIERGTRRRSGLLAFGGIFYCAAILTYPAAAGSLALVLACDLHRAVRSGSSWSEQLNEFVRRLKEKLVFWIGPALGIVAFVFVVTRDPESEVSGDGAVPWIARLFRAPLMLAYHLWRPWSPTGLTPVDDRLVAFSLTDPQVLASVTLCGAVSAVVIALLVRRRWGLACLWLAYVGALFPLCGITENVQFPSDRYAYFAALPIATALFIAIRNGRRWFALKATALAVVTLAWVPIARTQLAVWHDTESLTQHALTHLTRETYLRPMLMSRLAHYRLDYRGDPVGARELLKKAEESGWAMDPKWRALRENLVRYDEKPAQTPAPAAAWQHQQMGRRFAARGEFREAIEHFVAALRLAPEFPEARSDLRRLVPDDSHPDDISRSTPRDGAADSGHAF